jgi:segregation and condensation protein A
MAYTISLEIFEGPLDLLLHLIQKNKIDIYNIPIAAITEQYLEHLQAMQELDLDMASEFLLMAATLLSIKAKMLLPQTTIQEEQEDNDDPRKELVDRLIEYQKYKKAAEKLKIKQHNQAMFYSRPLDPMYLEDALKRFNPLENISLEDFKNILSVVLTETEDGETVKLITKGASFLLSLV